MVVHLESIEIDGYRSCRGTNFSPNTELSVLIGINGAGKTNVLHGIRLLDHRFLSGVRRTSGEPPLTGSTDITASFLVNGKRVSLKIAFSLIEGGSRSDEIFQVNEAWQLEAFTGVKTWVQMQRTLHTREWSRMPGVVNRRFSFFLEGDRLPPKGKQVEMFNPDAPENKSAVEALRAVAEFRSGISYYSASQFTDPTRCPSSFEVDEEGRLNEPYLENFGFAHLRFLHDLYTLKKKNSELYKRYCLFVSRQQLGLVSRLTWKEIELSTSTAEVRIRGSVKKFKKRKTLVVPKVQIGTSHITFNQLSEGTFKTLALIFYVVTDASRFLMIEEPEVCIHHGLLRRILETIKSHSLRKQTIISTHSDLLVDELDPKHLFVVEMTANGTRVTGLEKSLGKDGREALHSYLAESGPLGEYWRSGGFT